MPDFGRTAADYARHRAGFPPRFFDHLHAMNVIVAGQQALDLGTGTGLVARSLARRGMKVTGVDVSEPLLAQARRQAAEEDLDISFLHAPAEDPGCAKGAFSLVIAGQCWHWFDRAAAAAECRRLLQPGGHLVIAHLDWLPYDSNVVALTVQAIEDFGGRFSAKLDAAMYGIYPEWTQDAHGAGFRSLQTFSFDADINYSKTDWRGRIRASGPIGGDMRPDDVERFDALLTERLAHFPESLAVPHRVWALVAQRPTS